GNREQGEEPLGLRGEAQAGHDLEGVRELGKVFLSAGLQLGLELPARGNDDFAIEGLQVVEAQLDARPTTDHVADQAALPEPGGLDQRLPASNPNELAPGGRVRPPRRVEVRRGRPLQLDPRGDAAVAHDSLALEGQLDAISRFPQSCPRERGVERAAGGVQVAVEHLDLADGAGAFEAGEKVWVRTGDEVPKARRLVDRELALDLDARGHPSATYRRSPLAGSTTTRIWRPVVGSMKTSTVGRKRGSSGPSAGSPPPGPRGGLGRC